MPVVDARSFRDRIAPGEAKEQLGGFIMIDVPDLNETIRVASRIPAGESAASKFGRSKKAAAPDRERASA
jgi:hypothetical protein